MNRHMNTIRALYTTLAGLTALLLLAALGGCGPSFQMTAPARFVELDEENSIYDARFTTADGVVISVRELPHEPVGDLDFWVEAIGTRIRMNGGYALLETEDVRAASGHQGKQLRFGRDQNGTPFKYWVTIFVTEAHIHLIEAGGRSEQFDATESAVAQAITSITIR